MRAPEVESKTSRKIHLTLNINMMIKVQRDSKIADKGVTWPLIETISTREGHLETLVISHFRICNSYRN